MGNYFDINIVNNLKVGAIEKYGLSDDDLEGINDIPIIISNGFAEPDKYDKTYLPGEKTTFDYCTITSTHYM